MCFDIKRIFEQTKMNPTGVYFIGSCGGEICTAKDETAIFSSKLPPDVINITIDYCEKNGLNLEFYCEAKYVACTRENEMHIHHCNSTRLSSKVLTYSEMREYCMKHPPSKFLVTEDPAIIAKKFHHSFLHSPHRFSIEYFPNYLPSSLLHVVPSAQTHTFVR